jgi:hypothetical protein
METKRFSLVKPTLQTPFHIDFTWWKQYDNNWRVYLISCLCPEHQQSLGNSDIDSMIDWIDSETGEIQQVDGLQHVLINHCAKLEGFVTNHTSLVDAVFRTLLANGNTPLSPEELSIRLGRPAMTILLTLTGLQVYKGLRPVPRLN